MYFVSLDIWLEARFLWIIPLPQTLSITDRAYLLYDGTLLKHGTVEELSNDEEVRRLYLGSNFSM